MKKRVNVKDFDYKIEVTENEVVIYNGLEKKVRLLRNSFDVLKSCSSVENCNKAFVVTKAEKVIVYGIDANCQNLSRKTTSLNPADFGFETADELIVYINSLLQIEVNVSQITKIEILDTEAETTQTLGGKTIFRTAIRVSGFVNGSGITHNLNIDNYVNFVVMAWVSGDDSDKRKLNGLDESIGSQQFYFGALQVDTIDEIITDLPGGLFDELLIIIDYTKQDA